MIRFGPAGIGPVKNAISNLEDYHKLGLKACEIAFTYGIYIKKNEDAVKIGNRAKELGIQLSIHAPYWINLNSLDKKKIEESKKRILDCCKIGTLLNASCVVFHPGFYSKINETKVSLTNPPFKLAATRDSREEAFQNIKKAILEIKQEVKEKKYTPKLAPEVMGKINVFGSVEEIKRLVDETGCGFCLDFAHILARYKEYRLDKTFKEFSEFHELHIHFSGIEYGEKGEKPHKKTSEVALKNLIKSIPKSKNVTIINESPSPIEDSVMGLKLYIKLLH